MKKIVILGGGISGLSLAHSLQKKEPSKIILLEAKANLGGLIQTIKKNDYLFELGPRALRISDPKIFDWLHELGLKDQIIFASHSAKERFLLKDNQLKKIPANFKELFFSSFFKPFLFAFFKDLFGKRGREEDESVSSFMERRIGTLAKKEIFQALVTGIYAGDMEHLSMRSCFPKLWHLEKKYRSLFRGFRKELKKEEKLISFKGGLKTLIQAIQNQLTAEIFLEEKVIKIEKKGKELIIFTSQGKEIVSDFLFITVPIYQAATLFQKSDSSLSSLLQKIPYHSLVSIHMGFSEDVLRQKGFGYLSLPQNKSSLLGVTFDSSLFKEQNEKENETRLTIMMGGSFDPKIVHQSDEIILKEAKKALYHLNIQKEPDEILIHRAYQSIPQYPVGHFQIIKEIEKAAFQFHHQLFFSGAGLYGVAITDCILQSKKDLKNESFT